jgi:hypothetical protein
VHAHADNLRVPWPVSPIVLCSVGSLLLSARICYALLLCSQMSVCSCLALRCDVLHGPMLCCAVHDAPEPSSLQLMSRWGLYGSVTSFFTRPAHTVGDACNNLNRKRRPWLGQKSMKKARAAPGFH